MAEKVLRFVTVSGGNEVDRLTRDDDGTIRPAYPGMAADGVLSGRVHNEDETPDEAFGYLAANGWSNGNLMIDLDDLNP